MAGERMEGGKMATQTTNEITAGEALEASQDAERECADCGGWGRAFGKPCQTCGGTGNKHEPRPVYTAGRG